MKKLLLPIILVFSLSLEVRADPGLVRLSCVGFKKSSDPSENYEEYFPWSESFVVKNYGQILSDGLYEYTRIENYEDDMWVYDLTPYDPTARHGSEEDKALVIKIEGRTTLRLWVNDLTISITDNPPASKPNGFKVIKNLSCVPFKNPFKD
jgi:hypothetical protein